MTEKASSIQDPQRREGRLTSAWVAFGLHPRSSANVHGLCSAELLFRPFERSSTSRAPGLPLARHRPQALALSAAPRERRPFRERLKCRASSTPRLFERNIHRQVFGCLSVMALLLVRCSL